jgi:biotin synthase
MLDFRGKAQGRLLTEASEVRDFFFGRAAVVRGVIEVTNACVKSCDYCPMRIESPIDRYFRRPDEILASVELVRSEGIGVVSFQGGEVSATTRVLEEVIPAVRKLFAEQVEILLCLGDKPRDELERLKSSGADSYILKQETLDPVLHERMRHVPLEERLACFDSLVNCGYRVGVGTIVGLPGQTRKSLVEDALFLGRVGAHMISASPFIPAAGTPLFDMPEGDMNLTLNMMAVMRLLYPTALIPTVSALESRVDGGQKLGLDAGANVITVNFTPEQDSKNYQIYGSDRFVVRHKYAMDVLDQAGLSPLLGRDAYSFWSN